MNRKKTMRFVSCWLEGVCVSVEISKLLVGRSMCISRD